MTSPTTPAKIRVAVAGAAGKMGREAVTALDADERFDVVALLLRESGQASTDVAGHAVFTDHEELLVQAKPDVWVDFTDARSVAAHVDACLAHDVRAVVGATGYTEGQLAEWEATASERQLGIIVAPNFALGALLMIRFAREASRIFSDVEIIELHHDGKRDAPSGTAQRTANAIASARRDDLSSTSTPRSSETTASADSGKATEGASTTEGALPSRGLNSDGIHIHSVRLPGFVAHQEVIFGGKGETLTIRHDSTSRTSFMQGMILACEQVMNLKTLVYGLENLLW